MKGMHITPEQIRRFAQRSAATSMEITRWWDHASMDDHYRVGPSDNPAFDIAHGDVCPMCVQPALYRFKGGFADEPPGLPHANCAQCGYVE